jgi:sugar phosphate isomerase/epimerase
MVTRRDFLRKAGIAAAATAILPAVNFKPGDKKTGLILYTVRQEMATNPVGTLKAVADLGYNWIEAADYRNGLFYGMKPAEFKKAVESTGMEFLSSHNGINASNADKMIADAKEAGLKYLILPSLPGEWGKSLDGYKQAADFFNKVGEKCKQSGIKFGFHNHYHEFPVKDGQVPYDVLLKNTDPSLAFFELDLCWMTHAGKNPVDYIARYPGRFEIWHVKDLSKDKEDATLGEGTIDFKPIFAVAKQSGMKYWFIEQDNCKTHTPLESAKISRTYMIDKVL